MKKLSILIMALMLMTHGFAQEEQLDSVATTTNTTTGFHHTTVYVYGGIGILDWYSSLLALLYDGSVCVPHYDVGASVDYQYNRHWSVGLGTDFHGSLGLLSYAWGFKGGYKTDYDDYFCSLPVYAHLRCRIGHKSVVPHLEVKLGYAFPLNSVSGSYRQWYSNDNHIPVEYGSVYYGLMKAGGIYAGFDVGVNIKRHATVFGVTCMPIHGDFVDPDTNEVLSKIGPMFNVFARYSFTVLK